MTNQKSKRLQTKGLKMFKKRLLFDAIPGEGDPTLQPQNPAPTSVSEADLLRVKQEADAAKARVEALEAELE